MVDPVHLENPAAFEAVLRNYQMSKHARQVLADTRLVVLAGLAGGGRNSTINYLVEHYNYTFLVSDTTRPPKLRDGVMERDGVNYHFRSEAEMLHDIRQGEFVEAEVIHHQQVSGTSIRELERANQTGQIVIHEMEFGGTRFIAQTKPDAHIIGLLPPSYEEWLKRLQGRETIAEQELINRLHTAAKVLQMMLHEPYFKFVINSTIPACAEQVRAIVEQNQLSSATQADATAIAVDILAHVQARLEISDR
jgi:guanylate kinase